jgi:hypothetical protein
VQVDDINVATDYVRYLAVCEISNIIDSKSVVKVPVIYSKNAEYQSP